MRLDKYLKVSRLIKRRSVANDACDAGEPASAATGADGRYSLSYDPAAVSGAASAQLIAPVKTGDPAADIGAVELEGQDGIIPGNASGECHGSLPSCP